MKAVLIFSAVLVLVSGERNLTSPVVTDWGIWQNFAQCPENSFVVGMQLRTESYGGWFSDDTALNSVMFFCDSFNSSRQSEDAPILSHDGVWGSWGSKYFCDGGIVTGFQLRSEPNQGGISDDTAANNLRILCDGTNNYQQADGLDFGSWTEARSCADKEAVCGLSIQFYTDFGSGDETAMDGLMVKCCDVPDPGTICVPSDQWELIIECDNMDATSPTKCHYSRKVGTTNSTSLSEHHWDMLETYTNIGFSLGSTAPSLRVNFHTNVNISSSTGYDWKSATYEVFSEEVETFVEFEVPPGVKSELFQVYGVCGIYSSRATRFKRVDTEKTSSGGTKESVSYFEI